MNNKPVVRVEMQAPTGGSNIQWLSIDEGYVVLRGENLDKVGRVVQELVVDEVLSIKDDAGNQFFYPRRGMRRALINGKESTRTDVEVEAGSVEINRPIPPEQFELNPDVNEKLWDVDLKRRPASQP